MGSTGSAITSDARRVSVVIPTWNGGARFLELLDALADQDIDGGFELICVDSGSRDGTPEAAAKAGAYVFKIPPGTFNHGGTRNLAIARARGEVVALLTQDAVPTDASYLRNLAAVYDDPRVDGAYARQLPQPDCDPILAERLRIWSASRDAPEVKCLAAGDPEESVRRFDTMEPMERYLACAFDNVASSVRKSTWERHPLPQRSFGEDVAWAREILRTGGSIAYEPTAIVEHSHRIDLMREFKRLYCDHRNLIELFDLRTVPTWGTAFRGWKHQRGYYRDLLAGQELPRLERAWWRLYSVPYALLEGVAQFLGARSHWKVPESSFWAWVDRRLQAGV